MPDQSSDPKENPQDALEEDPGPADLGRVIDKLGFGCAQVTQIIMSGGMWIGDAAEVMILSAITKAISDDKWNMTSYQQGLVVSIVYVGVLLGNSVSGNFGDHYGRRGPILASSFGLAVLNLLTLCANGFTSLLFINFFLGFAIGIGQPPQVALSIETTPTERREEAVCGAQILFGLGELYAALLVWGQDPMMAKLHWRQLVIFLSIPSLLFFCVCLFFLYESPRILALQGRVEEAQAILARIRDCNGRPDVSLEFTSIQSERHHDRSMFDRWLTSLKLIFGKQLRSTTLVCCITCFSINLLYIGTFYAFPLILPDMKLHTTPGMALIASALFDLSGFVIAMGLAKLLQRRAAVVMLTFGQILSLVGFLYIRRNEMLFGDPSSAKDMLQVSMNGIKFFTSAVFMMVFIYYGEIFPTVARTTGFGTALACGRLGAVCAPLAYEYMRKNASADSFFYLALAATILNFGLFGFLRETKDMKLDDDFKKEDDMSEVVPFSVTRSSY